jgi:hypothetical protein
VKRKGRRLEPDFGRRELEIAARVYRYRRANKTSKADARKRVAKHLGVHVDTVRNAERLWKHYPVKVSVAAMALAIEADVSREKFFARSDALAARVSEVKRRRGKKSSRVSDSSE